MSAHVQPVPTLTRRWGLKACGSRLGGVMQASLVYVGLTAVVVSAFVVGVAAPAQANSCTLVGGGTSQDPYQIASAADIADILACGLDKSYRQTANIGPVLQTINPSSSGPRPGDGRIVRNPPVSFTGTYDGQGFVIELGLTSPLVGYGALFDTVSGPASFNDMVLTGTSSGSNNSLVNGVASLIGESDGGTVSVTDVHSSVKVSYDGGNYAGGMQASQNSGTTNYTRSSFTGEVDAPAQWVTVGGFSGRWAGVIADSFVRSAKINGDDGYTGGFYGVSVGSATVRGSYSASGVIGGGAILGRGSQIQASSGGVFWDNTLLPAPANAIQSPLGGLTGTAGKSTADMQTLSTFSAEGWLIADTWEEYVPGTNLWGICSTLNAGYPYLLAQVTRSEAATAGCAGSSGSLSSAGQSTAVPGIFLFVAGPVGRVVADSPVYFGSDRVAAASEYDIRVLSTGSVSPVSFTLASGKLTASGSMPSTMVRLPQLNPGTYFVRMMGKHVTGSTLQLTSQITVGEDGTFTAIGLKIPSIREP